MVTVHALDGFDEVVVATGVEPRVPEVPGIERAHSNADVVGGAVVPGRRIAVIGAGGNGVDVAHWLTHTTEDLEDWLAHWGFGDPCLHATGSPSRKPRTPARQVDLVQRKTLMIGKDLGKTAGVGPPRRDRAGGRRADQQGVVGADRPGRPNRAQYDELLALDSDRRVHLIGGADVAAELDAERAIEQGMRVVAAGARSGLLARSGSVRVAPTGTCQCP